MNDIKSVTQDMIFFLKENVLMKDTYFDSGYVYEGRNLSPRKIIVTGKIGKAKIGDSSIGNCIGENLFGKAMELTLDFCIYCGRGRSGADCEEVFSKIVEALMVKDKGLYIKEITAEKISYIKEAGVLQMPFKMSVDYYITKENQTIAISDFLLRSGN
ncbi:MAG: hypothetical protein RR048_04155 [Oscillospiraceae bacterium]